MVTWIAPPQGYGGGGGSGGAPTDAKYLVLAADGTLSAEVVLKDCFQGRLQVDSTTAISLQRYNGDLCVVNGAAVDPGSSGISCATTDKLIEADGTEAAGAMASSTLYYLYLSNASASYAASDLRASATAPSLLNGVKYLATSGNGANWRFCGTVATNASTQFAESAISSCICNEYNKRKKSLTTCPGYVDDNAGTTYTSGASAWAAANGGTGSRITLLSDGVTPTVMSAQAVCQNSNSTKFAFIGIGVDSTSESAVTSGGIGAGQYQAAAIAPRGSVLSAGVHTVDLLVWGETGTTSTFFADFQRSAFGNSVDVKSTVLNIEVMA